MKKQLSLTIGCLFLMAGLAFGQQSFAFSDGNGDPVSGTYNPGDTFTLTVMGTFSGFSAVGFSMWLETNSALAPFISVIGQSFVGATWNGAPNDDPNDYQPGFSPFPKIFNSNVSSPGFLASTDAMGTDGSTPPRTGDMGNTGATRAPGTYLLGTITFQLTGAPGGTFSLQTTTLGGRTSIFADSTFGDRPVPASVYTITIVPEPATTGLAVLGGVMLLAFVWKARRVLA